MKMFKSLKLMENELDIDFVIEELQKRKEKGKITISRAQMLDEIFNRPKPMLKLIFAIIMIYLGLILGSFTWLYFMKALEFFDYITLILHFFMGMLLFLSWLLVVTSFIVVLDTGYKIYEKKRLKQ
jgi:small-conductance mechanosensitive channel